MIHACFLFPGSSRVVRHIKGYLTQEGHQRLSDKYVLVQPGITEVVVYAIRSHSKPHAGKEVLDKISFWLQQQGLDKFVEVR